MHPNLQYNPVTLLGSLFHGHLSHSFLALAQGHVVKLPEVDSETQLSSWLSTENNYCIYLLLYTENPSYEKLPHVHATLLHSAITQ